MKTPLTCALIAALGTTSAFAETKALDPHVHGAANLRIIQEDSYLAIALDSPAASLLGFEHAPQTDAQHAAVDQLTLQLETFTGAILINAEAACTLDDADVAVLAESAHGDHDDHDEHDDDHGDEHHEEHEDKHHDDHDDDHHDDHHEDEASAHSDIIVAWTLSCDSPTELASIDVLLFEGNTYLENVSVEMLLDSGPKVQTLTPGNTVITLP